MIKVLHIIRSLAPGGAAYALLALIKESSKQGHFHHEILSLLPSDPLEKNKSRLNGIKVYDNLNWSDSAAVMAQADIIQVSWWNNPELNAFLCKQLPEVRMLIWCHVAGNSTPQIITSDLIEFADLTLGCSPFTCSVLSELNSDKQHKVDMLLAGADFSRLSGIERVPHKEFNIGYIGTVDFVKMHPKFVDMSAKINIPNSKFILCGSGNFKEIGRQIELSDRPSAFELKGYVYNIKNVLESLDIFGYPLCDNTYAAAELCLQEAMYAGIPSVVFPAGGIKMLVKDQKTGIVVHNESEYVKAIEYLYHNPELRKQLGKSAHEYAKNNFGAFHSALKANHIYKDVIKWPKRKRLPLFNSEFNIVKNTFPNRYVTNNFTGAKLFVSSLGRYATPFMVSMSDTNILTLIDADEQIANASQLLASSGSGGIAHYLEFFKDDAFLNFWMGLVWQKKQNHEKALSCYQNAIKYHFDHWRVLWYQSLSSYKLGKIEDAKIKLQTIIGSNPKFDHAQALLAKIE